MRSGWLLAVSLLASLSSAAPAESIAQAARPLQIAEWLGPERYPPAALRAGEEGRVVVIIEVAADGSPHGCRTRGPSVLPLLEAGTCQAVMSDGRFAPALDSRGRPVAGTVTLPVRWVIPASPFTTASRQPITLGSMDMMSIFAVGADDKVASCQMGRPGHLVSVPPEGCVALARFDATALRQALKISGPFRVGLAVTMRSGDVPPAPAVPTLPGKELVTVLVREGVNAEGDTVPCTSTVSGQFARNLTPLTDPCRHDTDQRKLLGPLEKGTARHLALVTRMALLPPAN